MANCESNFTAVVLLITRHHKVEEAKKDSEILIMYLFLHILDEEELYLKRLLFSMFLLFSRTLTLNVNKRSFNHSLYHTVRHDTKFYNLYKSSHRCRILSLEIIGQ
jgi:hypothetical protein